MADEIKTTALVHVGPAEDDAIYCEAVELQPGHRPGPGKKVPFADQVNCFEDQVRVFRTQQNAFIAQQARAMQQIPGYAEMAMRQQQGHGLGDFLGNFQCGGLSGTFGGFF